MSLLQEFRDRELLAQMTNEAEIERLLDSKDITFYIGFDPTADSLHIGHFLQMKIMAHMQRAGHHPIAIFGGGTAMIGDPSGKSDMRKMLTKEIIAHNIECFKQQMAKFIDIDDGKALFVNNADWLYNLNYIEFIRDVGPHFSVNRMLSAECYKSRMETGLTFLEFNYMIMQSYDFYRLFMDHGCILQFGGDDQWSNIIGGVELIRRKTGKEAYGMTFRLLENSEGVKMGKTEKGAIWLNADKTPPYDFYQYWRNINDADVIKCMKMLTFMSLDEISQYAELCGSDINEAKEKLAYELTKLIHGETEADKALSTAHDVYEGAGFSDDMPTTVLDAGDFIDNKIKVAEMLVKSKLASSKTEAKRLIVQGCVFISDDKVESFDSSLDTDLFTEGIILKKGKKVYHRFILS
ncbi:MAG: tyrosine--tRNA ligase [Eubacteriales bacterium]|nr:tyrosine--tRNA ligase [Eubacteriales bacterium]